mmetsp:Transcript_77671/g.173823  ORF Transcript_77671/g.173823 Transcript_77671/m.173823 type:complete len:234 (-) Transcript_77671:37-738(-)
MRLSLTTKVAMLTLVFEILSFIFGPVMLSVVMANLASTMPRPTDCRLCVWISMLSGPAAESGSMVTLAGPQPAISATDDCIASRACASAAMTMGLLSESTMLPLICLGAPPVAFPGVSVICGSPTGPLAAGVGAGASVGGRGAGGAVGVGTPKLGMLESLLALEALEELEELPVAFSWGAAVALASQEASPHVLFSWSVPLQGRPPSDAWSCMRTRVTTAPPHVTGQMPHSVH